MRKLFVGLILLGQLLYSFGMPLPASGHSNHNSSTPYPCQFRPCGCVSSDKCWAGDCCCFTLEEKLRWADKRGISVPGHVRPMVAARQASPKTKKSCCEAADASCRETPSSPTPAPIRWAVGIVARKCRGEEPVAGAPFDPMTTVTPGAHPIAELTNDSHAAPRSDRFATLTHTPQAPPPRIG